MKNLFLYLLASLFAGQVIAQPSITDTKSIEQFMKTKTLVISENMMMSPYNMVIKTVMEKYWKLTNFEVVASTEFEKNRNNPELSFLIITDGTTIKSGFTESDVIALKLVLGGDYKEVSEMPTIASLPLKNPKAQDFYSCKVPILVQFIQKQVETAKANPTFKNADYIKFFNEKNDLVKAKTLYLLKEDLNENINTEANFGKEYKGKFKIVDVETMDELTFNAPADAAFLHVASPKKGENAAICYKLIMAADGEILFYNQHMTSPLQGGGFLKLDAKKLGK